MTAAIKWNRISEAEDLRGELLLEVKHEYMGGVLYAMAGAGNAHNRMATNVTVTLGAAAWSSLSGLQFRYQDSVETFHSDAVLLSGCVGGVPEQSPDRLIPG